MSFKKWTEKNNQKNDFTYREGSQINEVFQSAYWRHMMHP